MTNRQEHHPGMEMLLTTNIDKAAALIQGADGLLITAGAGMGIDSGLPDFRGNRGFWRAYPALGRLGLQFEDMANPRWFFDQPRLAWGFYGHRLQLYRATLPHAGFQLLHEIAQDKPHGAFIYTSNVDGQFQKAGFAADRIVECHGSIHHLQCLHDCSDAVWVADGFVPDVDAASCTLRSALPACPQCGRLARPNILMFGDCSWIPSRTSAQELRFRAWLKSVRRLVIVEIGAGIDLPTIRRKGESLMAPLIRINPSDAEITAANVLALPLGARHALERIAASVRR